MTSRERILAAFRHEESDRMPIDFAGTDCSGIHITAYDLLKKHLGIDPGPIRLGCSSLQIAEPDSEVMDVLKSDAVGLFFHPRKWRTWDSPYGMPVEVADRWRPETLENGDRVTRDSSGIVRTRQAAKSSYFDPVNPPLADIENASDLNMNDELFHRWDWSAVLDESVEEYGLRARELYKNTDRAVVALWRMHLVQSGQIMRGYETFLMDMLSNESMARAIFEKLLGVYMERTDRFLEAVKDSIDVIFLTDDLGAQNGPLFNPELFRHIVKPYFAELIGYLKKKSGKPIILHSCGAVSEFIPDMIEMGVDALNPVQISAAGMSPSDLKREFGKDIVFWGGGCDTQKVLNHGTVQEIRDHVRRNIETFAPGGGFVFTQVHNIQPEVPVANIVAMYEAAWEYGQ